MSSFAPAAFQQHVESLCVLWVHNVLVLLVLVAPQTLKLLHSAPLQFVLLLLDNRSTVSAGLVEQLFELLYAAHGLFGRGRVVVALGGSLSGDVLLLPAPLFQGGGGHKGALGVGLGHG